MIILVLIFSSQFSLINENSILLQILSHNPEALYLSVVWVLVALLKPERALTEPKMIMRLDMLTYTNK